MSNLQLATKISPELTKSEQVFVLANLKQKARGLNKKELTDGLIDCISKAYWECKYATPVAAELKLMAEELAKDVLTYFSTLTLEDISISFHNGVRKLYGEFAGISNANMSLWISKYMASSDRLLALKKQQQFLNPPPKVIAEEEKKKIVHEGCLMMFEQFKSKGGVIDFGNVNYDYLDSLGLIPFNKQRKNEFIKKAQDKLRVEAMERKQSAKGTFAIRDAVKDLEQANDSKSSKVISEAKRIALNTFFSELVEVGEELKTILNEIK